MGTTTTRADELAEELTAEGVRATADPAAAIPQLPCVLVGPPTLDYRARTRVWRLLVLAPGPGTRASWDAMDQLLDDLEAVCPLDGASPGSTTLPTLGDPVACYVATYTESI